MKKKVIEPGLKPHTPDCTSPSLIWLTMARLPCETIPTHKPSAPTSLLKPMFKLV